MQNLNESIFLLAGHVCFWPFFAIVIFSALYLLNISGEWRWNFFLRIATVLMVFIGPFALFFALITPFIKAQNLTLEASISQPVLGPALGLVGVALLAILFLIFAHIVVLFLALRNEELSLTAKTVWAILSVIMIFFMPFSPIPFYFLYAEARSDLKTFGLLTLIALALLDGSIFWAHIETTRNYQRSAAMKQFLPGALEGWAVQAAPEKEPFITPDLLMSAMAVRTYENGTDHQISLLIMTAPWTDDNNQKMLLGIPAHTTAEMASLHNISIRLSGYTYINDCPAIYLRDDHAFVVMAGDYAVYVTSATEPVETLEQLARGIDMYELRRVHP